MTAAFRPRIGQAPVAHRLGSATRAGTGTRARAPDRTRAIRPEHRGGVLSGRTTHLDATAAMEGENR